MFDFFIETGKGLRNNLQAEDLFHSADNCNKKACHEFKLDKQDINIIALGKNKDFPEIADNNECLIMVFGYCFSRIANTDAEIKQLYGKELLEIYKKHGKEIVHRIKGSYVLIVYNFNSKILEIFTDELNIRTINYVQTKDKLIISSSLSAFIKYLPDDFSTVNTKAVIEYTLFDFILTDETFIKSIKVLQPASQLHYADNQLSINKYWDIFDAFENSKPELKEKDAYNKIERILKQNLKAYLSEPQKTAIALTGGYDSRTNLALLNGKHKEAYYYSYGIKNSYDIIFARKVAQKLKLNFHPLILDKEFENDFENNALIAINQGDGMVEMSRANYIYAFKKLAKDFDFILTGLFGSELIKRPTSLGGYIDKNIQSLLFAEHFDESFERIIEKSQKNACINQELLLTYKEEILNDLKSNPYINNQCSDAKKYFFYMVGWGMRKYFMKEIKAERLFVENLHPFMDIEFIETLLKTPFPWLYHWGKKKSLLDNLEIHKFYAHLIHKNNKKLANIPTTHAYKPKYLLNKLYLPMLIAQYAFFRKKIKKTGIFNNTQLIQKFYLKQKPELEKFNQMFNNDKITEKYPKEMKEFNKLISLQVWLKENNLFLA